MENEIQKESINSDSYSNIQLTPAAVNSLNETRKWATFFAILGFIIIGFLIIVMIGALMATSFFPYPINTISGPLLTVMFLGIIALYFFPVYFIFQFAMYAKRAIQESSSELMEKSMNFLKLYYRFVGILVIVILSIYILIGIFAGLALAFFS